LPNINSYVEHGYEKLRFSTDNNNNNNNNNIMSEALQHGKAVTRQTSRSSRSTGHVILSGMNN